MSSSVLRLLLGGLSLVNSVSSQTTYHCTTELTRHPHFDNCNKYYMCKNGKLYIDTCPRGQRFDSLAMECMESVRAICAQRPTPEIEGPGFRCASERGDFLHEHLCDRFYRCVDWTWTLRVCPAGKLFDQQSGTCLEQAQAECGSLARPEGAWTPGPEKPVSEEEARTKTTPRYTCRVRNGLFPHAELCQAYYECYNWLPYDRTCPEGSLFEEHTRACSPETRIECGTRRRPDGASPVEAETTTDLATTPEQEATTKPSTLSPQTPGTEPEHTTRTTPRYMCRVRNGLFPHAELCEAYYECYNWLPYDRTCPQGSLFEEHTSVCSPETRTECGTRRRPDGASPVEPETTTPLATTPGQETTTFLASTPRQESTTKEDEGSEEVKCPQPNGSFPHPKDKHKFLVCVANVLHLFHCPANLVYDPVLGVCAWPQ